MTVKDQKFGNPPQLGQRPKFLHECSNSQCGHKAKYQTTERLQCHICDSPMNLHFNGKVLR